MKSPRELFQKGKTLFFYADSCKLSAAESFQKKKKIETDNDQSLAKSHVHSQNPFRNRSHEPGLKATHLKPPRLCTYTCERSTLFRYVKHINQKILCSSL